MNQPASGPGGASEPDRTSDPGAESQSGEPIKVVIVNDYQIVVEGLRNMLEPYAERVSVVEVEAGGLPEKRADIALFDMFAVRRSFDDRISSLSDDNDIDKVVLYTWEAPREFLADASDVDAVVSKTTSGDALVEALERIHAGERIGFEDLSQRADLASNEALTSRENEVLALLARGYTNRQIAAELYLSVDTIKSHVKRIFSKLGVSNRTQAAISATELGLGAPPA